MAVPHALHGEHTTLLRGPAGLHVTYPRDRRRILGDDASLRRFGGPDGEAIALSPELERLRSGDSSSPDQEVGRAAIHLDLEP